MLTHKVIIFIIS